MTATAEPSTAQPAAGIEDQPTVLASPEEFAGRLVESAVGAFDMFSIYVGEQLGLYRCLHEQGPATSIELAARTCMDEEPGHPTC